MRLTKGNIIVQTLTALVTFLTASCSNDDIQLTPVEPLFSGEIFGEKGSFDPETFSLDTTPINEDGLEIRPTDPLMAHYEDFAENWLGDIFDEDDNVKEVIVTFNGDEVTLSSEKNLVVTRNGAHITIKSEKKRIYRLNGMSENGSIKIYSDKKFGIILDGITLTNPHGACINIQKGNDIDEEGNPKLVSKRCYMMIATGTENVLTDGETYTDTPENEDEKGCIFSEGKLLIGSTATIPEAYLGIVPSQAPDEPITIGKLTINARGKNGIASDDYVYLHAYSNILINTQNGDGIKTHDGVFIGGGVLNIDVKGIANKGINTSGPLEINGGWTGIINTSTANETEEGISYAACLKSDSLVNITSGDIVFRSKEAEGSIGIYTHGPLTITGGSVSGYCYGNVLKASGEMILDDERAKLYLFSTNDKAKSE